jgi:hypothetical protein
MGETEGERDQPANAAEAAHAESNPGGPMGFISQRGRRVWVAAALVVASLVVAVVFVADTPVGSGPGGSRLCSLAATPGPAGISRECAIEIARSGGNSGALISVKAGTYGDLVNRGGYVDPNRLVWAVRLAAPAFCLWPPLPPPSGPYECQSFGPGSITLALDLMTGEILIGWGAY